MEPETDTPAIPELPASEAPAPSPAPAKEEATPAPSSAPETTAATGAAIAAEYRKYPSLYDSTGTTILAIVLGIVIVGGIQVAVQNVYKKAKNEHELLTRFVVSLVALVVGAYITDLLIAGPDTSLLSDDEHTIILGFIKDICLMVFAFYFGTKASASPPSSGASE
jgi:hypothetical protein